MKTTLKIVLLSTLFFTSVFADDGQQGTGGRTCPPECTAEAPQNCPPGCPAPGGGRSASEDAEDGVDGTIFTDTLKLIAEMYFLG
jgi:hypothetical protein